MQQPLHAPVQPERSALPVHERRLETTAPLPAPQSSLCTSLTAAAVPARTALAAALSTPSLTATLASATLAAAVAATSLASATIAPATLASSLPAAPLARLAICNGVPGTSALSPTQLLVACLQRITACRMLPLRSSR